MVSIEAQIKSIQKVGKIVDIKCGEVTQWNLLKYPYIKNGSVKNYNHGDEREHLSKLWNSQIISDSQYRMAKELLKPNLTAVEFLLAKKVLRFGLLRWTVDEVMDGYKTLLDNSIIRLYDAFQSKGITKIDIIAWVNNKYVEFSNIILWTHSGKPYAYIPGLKRALSEDILLYEAEGNYVKVAKRMYSLAKQFGDVYVERTIQGILNSPLGRLYMLTADLEVIRDFPNAITQTRKRKQLDLLRDYFAKLYFPELDNAVPNVKLLPKLEEVLQSEMKITLKANELLPIPQKYQI
jgi:hypothetical protein